MRKKNSKNKTNIKNSSRSSNKRSEMREKSICSFIVPMLLSERQIKNYSLKMSLKETFFFSLYFSICIAYFFFFSQFNIAIFCERVNSFGNVGDGTMCLCVYTYLNGIIWLLKRWNSLSFFFLSKATRNILIFYFPFILHSYESTCSFSYRYIFPGNRKKSIYYHKAQTTMFIFMFELSTFSLSIFNAFSFANEPSLESPQSQRILYCKYIAIDNNNQFRINVCKMHWTINAQKMILYYREWADCFALCYICFFFFVFHFVVSLAW